MSRQKLGQHFLYNPAWRQRIARTLPPDANTTWLEIGPGHGEMTEFLARHSSRVVAIETDPALASTLRQRAATEWPNVEVVESDILSVDLAELVSAPPARLCDSAALAIPKSSPSNAPSGTEAGTRTSRVHQGLGTAFGARGCDEEDRQTRTIGRFRVYGNLPYYITSPIVSHLFRCASQIDSIHIVIQWEVAARITATPGRREYAYLSALCQYFAHPEIGLRIPPGAFRPAPKVNSALVAMTLPGERAQLRIRDDAAFLKFLQNCFSQKRKTLRNNLKNSFPDEAIAAALAACKLMPKSRAEEISLPQFAELYRALAPDK